MAEKLEVWVRENDGRVVSLAESSSEGLARGLLGWAYKYVGQIRFQTVQPETRQAFLACAVEYSARQRQSASGLRDDAHLERFLSVTGERDYSSLRQKELMETAMAIMRVFGRPIHIGTDIGTGLRPVRGGEDAEAGAEEKPQSGLIYIPR